MPITQGESATTVQTFGSAYQTAYESPADGPPSSLIKVTCLTEGATGRINGTQEFDIQPGASNAEYIKSDAPGGIRKLELKRSGAVDATGYWNARVSIP